MEKTGQKTYKPVYNYIEAPNNNENCPLNKATYSVELCDKIFKIYAPKGGSVFDPFMGSGTTAIAAIENNLNYVGTEISSDEIKWIENRIKSYKGTSLGWDKQEPKTYKGNNLSW